MNITIWKTPWGVIKIKKLQTKGQVTSALAKEGEGNGNLNSNNNFNLFSLELYVGVNGIVLMHLFICGYVSVRDKKFRTFALIYS